jgi:hypothetical protein
MPGWFIPALKLVLPHLGTVISAASPVFTRKRSAEAVNQFAEIQQQIAELQTATSENAAHIRQVAEHLEGTIVALEQAAQLAEARLRRLTLWCVVAVGSSAIALVVSVATATFR